MSFLNPIMKQHVIELHNSVIQNFVNSDLDFGHGRDLEIVMNTFVLKPRLSPSP